MCKLFVCMIHTTNFLVTEHINAETSGLKCQSSQLSRHSNTKAEMSSLTLGLVLQTCFLFGGALSQQEMWLKTQVQVEEHGMRYNQTVEYDPVTTAVKLTVPKHLNIDASTVIFHKPSNSQMLLDPVREYCELKKVPNTFDPEDMFLSSSSMTANAQVLNPEMAKEVRRIEVTQGKLSLAKRKQLLKSIQDLCRGLPIFVVDEIDITDAEYENGFITLNITNAHNRVKRAWTKTFVVFCDDLAHRCTKDKPAGAQYCQWFVTCPAKNASERCKAEHLRTDKGWSCAMCCKEGKKGKMCGCNEIQDASSFTKCQ